MSAPRQPLDSPPSGGVRSADAEHELAEEALRFRLHVANTLLATIEWDPGFRVASFSPRAEALFGWSADEVVGKRIDEIPWLLDADWPRIREIMRAMTAGELRRNVVVSRNVRKDGTVIHCEWCNSVLYDADGKLVTVLSLVLDVTERVRTEAALRASEERLREQLALEDRLAKIAQSVPGLICSYRLRSDGTACFPFASAAAEDMWGVAPEEAARDAAVVFARVHPDDIARVRQVIEESARAMSRWHAGFRFLHPTKGLRWYEGWSVPRVEPDGSVIWHGFLMDVTDRRRDEEALRESDRRKSEFLAVLSHELRSPLAPIRAGIHVLERAPSGSEQAARAKEVIGRQTEHLARLIDDLLDVTRISRGKIALNRSTFDVREIVRQTSEDHRTLFADRGIDLRVETGAPAWIHADRTRISQVVSNLLQNAAKFTPDGGVASVTAEAVGGGAEIRVRDSGVGFDAALLERMFRPFEQADHSLARTQGGLGLGLALVKGIAELHGGSVSARSLGAGRGSEFVVWLPAVAAPERQEPRAPAPATRRALTVLVIEDNVDTARTLADVLELSGHRVHVAYDGGSGIAKALELEPDVVVCDIGLPDVNGYEIARTLRGDDRLRRTRLVALSGYTQPEDRDRALAAGFDVHLGKPAPLDELGDVVAAT